MDINKLAREAGIQPPEVYTGDHNDKCPWIANSVDLARFAALVAEECAKVAQRTGEVAAEMYGDGAECLSTADLCAEAIRKLFKP